VLQSIQNLQDSFAILTNSLSSFYESCLYIDDLRQFFRSKEREDNRKQLHIKRIEEIEVCNLTFRYMDQLKPAIQNVRFKILPGQKIAIVGENGSGKTTLIKCLTGLYETEPGMIRINGQPIQQIHLESYQERIAVLFQDFIRYHFSAKENIGFGNLPLLDDLEKIREAAKQSGVDEYLCSLPEKYDSILGRYFDGGQELSGGQWQKIALARALFRESDLIVLDEPTSALDPRSEVEIIELLFDITQDKAVLFITHRLGAACMADYILVMQDGMIVEQGSHEELLRLGGVYSKLYRSQSKWYLRKEGVGSK